MTLAFLADEHVKRVLVTELRANGYDVVWVDGGFDPGTSDQEHLRRSRNDGRVILSNDADFARLHEDYDHAGVVLYDDQNMSISEWMTGIKRIDRFVPEDELAGSLVWIDDWID